MAKFLTTAIAVGAFALISASAFGQSTLNIAFADPAWDGKTVPAGQQCSLSGGMGATPALQLTGVPDGTSKVTLAFNDETYTPMGNGGHGIIGFDVTPTGGSVLLPSVPGESDQLPTGVSVVTKNRGTGDYDKPGYLPPCSGGQGNLYSATVTALDASGAKLAENKIELGHY
jgi:hypothetical protein